MLILLSFFKIGPVSPVAPVSLSHVRCTVRQRQVKLSALDLAPLLARFALSSSVTCNVKGPDDG
jgi:hypothetical protein